MSHEDPVMVEGGGGSTGVEHTGVLFQDLLEGLQVTRVRLRGDGGHV